MKRIDDAESELFINALVYGKSGTGKTSFGVSAPDPLVLLSERQGLISAKAAAKRAGLPVPTVMHMETIQDYQNVLRALHGDRSLPFRIYEPEWENGKQVGHTLVHEGSWPKSVVLDSLTDVARLIIEDIRRIAPPKKGQDGLPVDSQRFWNVLEDRLRRVVVAFRDVPMHTLFLCLLDDREIETDNDGKRRWVGPSLPMRKIPEIVGAACNVVASSYKREVRTQNPQTRRIDVIEQFGVMLSGPECYMLKRLLPLRQVEIPNFTHWVSVVTGSVAPDAVAAPLASGESLQSTEEEEQQPPQREAQKPEEQEQTEQQPVRGAPDILSEEQQQPQREPIKVRAQKGKAANA